MPLGRANEFFLGLAIALLVPLAFPGVGLDYPFFFVFLPVLLCWFVFTWDKVMALASKGSKPWVFLGLGVIAADYALHVWGASSLGLVDFLVIFVSVAIVFFGLGSLRLFWVPTFCGVLFLLAYQLDNIPFYFSLQNWVAGVDVWLFKTVGIEYVTIGNMANLHWIILLGLLSSMVLVYVKLGALRTIVIIGIGFAAAFFIEVVRILVVYFSFEYLGVDAGITMHVYSGYLILFAWMLSFWLLVQKYGAFRSSSTAAVSNPSLRTEGNR